MHCKFQVSRPSIVFTIFILFICFYTGKKKNNVKYSVKTEQSKALAHAFKTGEK